MQIKDFKVLPVKVLDDKHASHQLLYKQHMGREVHSKKLYGKTLFVLNLPPYCDEESLRRLFSDCGHIRQIDIQKSLAIRNEDNEKSTFFKNDSDMGVKVAYIIFQTPKSIKKALALFNSLPGIFLAEDKIPTAGIKKWTAAYDAAIPDHGILLREAEADASKFNNCITKNFGNCIVKDAEGWITIKHKKKQSSLLNGNINNTIFSKREKKKRANKELLNFYTFQVKESKLEHIAHLRKKFEDDKRKIALMRTTRKFKPY